MGTLVVLAVMAYAAALLAGWLLHRANRQALNDRQFLGQAEGERDEARRGMEALRLGNIEALHREGQALLAADGACQSTAALQTELTEVRNTEADLRRERDEAKADRDKYRQEAHDLADKVLHLTCERDRYQQEASDRQHFAQELAAARRTRGEALIKAEAMAKSWQEQAERNARLCNDMGQARDELAAEVARLRNAMDEARQATKGQAICIVDHITRALESSKT